MLMLVHVGFNLPIVKWIVDYITLVSFLVLINGTTSKFFNPIRGLRHVVNGGELKIDLVKIHDIFL
jgi:hypothetical protein